MPGCLVPLCSYDSWPTFCRIRGFSSLSFSFHPRSGTPAAAQLLKSVHERFVARDIGGPAVGTELLARAEPYELRRPKQLQCRPFPTTSVRAAPQLLSSALAFSSCAQVILVFPPLWEMVVHGVSSRPSSTLSC